MEKLIYAVDDEETIRELYQCLIEQAGYSIICFEDGYKMLEALNKQVPDLFILDIMLDGIDGFEILKQIRNKYIDIPVIMVSAKGEEISKVKGLNLGADDYISKPFGTMEFIARVNSKLRLKQKNKLVYEYKDITIDDESHEIKVNDELLDLSITEYNLLLYFIKNHNKALKREEIWNNIWNDEYLVETRSLDMHITKLRKQIVNSEVIIESIRGIGYKLK